MSRFSVEQTQDGFLFKLVADNGEIVAASQEYATKVACLKGIESVQVNAPLAPVEDQTVKGFEAEKCPKFEVYTEFHLIHIQLRASFPPWLSVASVNDASASPPSAPRCQDEKSTPHLCIS